MRRISSYDEISRLVSKQFKRGVMTNNFLIQSDYTAGIAGESLFYHEWDGGLLVFKRLPGYDRMYYHITDSDVPCKVELLNTVVTEIPHKPGREDAAADYLLRHGFYKAVERVRLCRHSDDSMAADLQIVIRFASASDADNISALLHSCFDRYTGCIPEGDELCSCLGSIYCAFGPDSSLTGLLHFSDKGNGTEIRHLAVREDLRGAGIASALLAIYHSGTHKSLVWTGADNHAALELYRKHGYEPDGWTSEVLLYGGY